MIETLKELRAIAKKFGYIVKTDGDEIEVYPKGKRGNASYFTDCKDDAAGTIRKTFQLELRDKVKKLTGGDLVICDAIDKLSHYYGLEWREKLLDCWLHGRKPYEWDQFDHSYMQSFRNSNGLTVLSPVINTH